MLHMVTVLLEYLTRLQNLVYRISVCLSVGRDGDCQLSGFHSLSLCMELRSIGERRRGGSNRT